MQSSTHNPNSSSDATMPPSDAGTTSFTRDALIDPLTGVVIDRTHPLRGRCVSDKVLCIPGGRGSCTGSQAMLELVLNGKAPRAIILRDRDSILCAGAIVAEEFFGEECGAGSNVVPIVCAVGEERFARLVEDGRDELSIEILGDGGGGVRIGSGDGGMILTRDLLRLEDALERDSND